MKKATVISLLLLVSVLIVPCAFVYRQCAIGLFPDVGGSYFLERLCPGHTGLCLGMTGRRVNAEDARYLNLATHVVSHHDLPVVEVYAWLFLYFFSTMSGVLFR